MRFDIAGKLELRLTAGVFAGSRHMQFRGYVTIPMICPVCHHRFSHEPTPIFSWVVRINEDRVKEGYYHLQDWPTIWDHVLKNLVEHTGGNIACRECGVVSRLSANSSEYLKSLLNVNFNNAAIHVILEEWGFVLDLARMEYTFNGTQADCEVVLSA